MRILHCVLRRLVPGARQATGIVPAAGRAPARVARRGGVMSRAWMQAATLLVALAAGSVPSSLAAQASDPLRIENKAILTYRNLDGSTGIDSAVAVIWLRATIAATLEPSRDVANVAGERRVLAHVLTNTGTSADEFRLAAAGPPGWPLGIYIDVDGDSALGPGDQPLAGPVPLARGASAILLLVVDLPLTAPAGTVSVSLSATSGLDAAVRVSVQDRILVSRVRGDSLSALAVGKVADRQAAARGDTVRYTINYANVGTGASSAATLVDALPASLRYVPQSLMLGSRALTDAADADEGDASSTTVRVALGALPAGAAGSVSFRAVVTASAGAGIARNVATLGTADTSATAGADVAIELPALTLAKQLVGADSVAVGDEVAYRLAWVNTSADVAVRDAELVDTLPVALSLVRAEGNPVVEGRVIRWRLGNLAPGQTGELALVTRADRPSTPADRVVNIAMLRGVNADAVAASALAIQIAGFTGSELGIAKAAGVLDAALGDAVPYTVTLTNRGRAPLTGLVLRDMLPKGLRLVRDQVRGADSVRIVGREARFFVAAPLAPGARHVVRYLATVVQPGREDRLVNVAIAEAEAGRVRSDTARAIVRVRRQLALRSQQLVGKVWFDRNRDNVQQPGELGVAGIPVWSADGEMVVTDAEGRFSFRDLASGVHALRLDTAGAPRGWMLARADEQVTMIRADGWTTPRATFRLVPRPGAEATCDSTMAANASGAVRVASRDGSALHVAVPAPVRPIGAADTAARVAPLRSSEEREAESQRAFIAGPEVRFLGVSDGVVVASNRAYVGLKGEPGAPVRLYDGARLLREGTLRPDGRQDFVGIELAAGPHVMRAWMKNSFGQERWDSVAVHRSGDAVRLESAMSAVTLRAEAPDSVVISVRVLDTWGVPLATRPRVTVRADGAEVAAIDADASSVGVQVVADADGIVRVPLRAGRDVRMGRLALAVGKAEHEVALRVLPSVRPLVATGAGYLGVGAAPASFGAVTVRGAVSDETAVTVSYDSRRSGRESEFLGRGFDPLDESRYPTLGDGSERRIAAPSAKSFSARVERGFDYVELGDLQTTAFGAGDALAGYRRALTGASARVTTGAATWNGFGTITRQSLQQRQIRGDGSSGPYVLGRGVRGGTERIAIEVRARDNAARVISREELVRFTDYTIDYVSGAVLLRRLVPAADAYGNPVFVVGYVERLTGGDAHLVGGLRLDLDARRMLGAVAGRRLARWDSIGVAFSGVRDAGAGDVAIGSSGYTLGGAALRLARSGVSVGAQVARGQSTDSAGTAAQVDARWTLGGDRASLGATWMSVGPGFAAPGDARLQAAVNELRLGGELRLAAESRLALRHEWQRFSQYGASRRVTTARAEERVAGRGLSQEIGLTSDVQPGAAAATAVQARATATLADGVDTWVEGVAPMGGTTAAAPVRPRQLGLGASYRLVPGLRLDGSHKWAALPQGDAMYQVSALNLRAERVLKGEAWGGIERAGAARSAHAAVLGWNQRLAIAGGWSASATMERRFGLSGASILDPVRALPFAQPEQERWSAGTTLEWLPTADLARFAMRGELHDGRDRDGNRFEVTGDAALTPSIALLTRHDWAQYHQLGLTGREYTRQDRSLLGVALRPAADDRLNALVKAEWRRSVNPLGAAVATSQAGEERTIAAADVIWAPMARTELAVRYAMRWSDGAPGGAADVPRARLMAQFAGARAERTLPAFGPRAPQLRARLDARVLAARGTGATAWSVAPSLVAHLGPRLELEGGWRAGMLQDLDFAANGGRGFFASLGVRFTEDAFLNPAAFWRERVTQ